MYRRAWSPILLLNDLFAFMPLLLAKRSGSLVVVVEREEHCQAKGKNRSSFT